MSNQQIFEFPCRFPIKIMAEPYESVSRYILDVLEKHIEDSENIEFNTRMSKNNNYISITAIFTATSKDQLDNLYQEISTHKQIHMVL